MLKSRRGHRYAKKRRFGMEGCYRWLDRMQSTVAVSIIRLGMGAGGSTAAAAPESAPGGGSPERFALFFSLKRCIDFPHSSQVINSLSSAN